MRGKEGRFLDPRMVFAGRAVAEVMFGQHEVKERTVEESIFAGDSFLLLFIFFFF